MNKLLLFSISLLVAACSSSNIEKVENQNFALFDSSYSANVGFTYQYTIRLKVFDNAADADSFISANKSKINFNLIKRLNSKENQYFVESEIFNSRFKAEESIADLKLNKEYSEAAMIIRKIEFPEIKKESNSD